MKSMSNAAHVVFWMSLPSTGKTSFADSDDSSVPTFVMSSAGRKNLTQSLLISRVDGSLRS